MFKNLRLYRVTSQWPDSEQALSERLRKVSFVPVGPLAEKRSGWESPANDPEMLCRRVAGADLLRMRTQSRLLPTAAINEALDERVAEYRSRMQEEPSRRVLRRLREETRDELLPKALTKSERTDAFFILADGLLGIDAASISKAERFIDLLRATLEGFEFTPVSYRKPVGELLTAIFLGQPIDGFQAARECRMQDLSEEKAVVTWRNADLTDPSIRQHVIDGMKITHLGLDYRELLSGVLAEDGAISKLRFPEEAVIGSGDDEDPLARQDAAFAMLTGAVRQLAADLRTLLGGYADEQTRADAA